MENSEKGENPEEVESNGVDTGDSLGSKKLSQDFKKKKKLELSNF